MQYQTIMPSSIMMDGFTYVILKIVENLVQFDHFDVACRHQIKSFSLLDYFSPFCTSGTTKLPTGISPELMADVFYIY
jgi:hypothetical protein